MLLESTVSIRLVRATIATAEREGIPRDRFLHLAGFDHQRLESEEGRVPLTEFYALVELVLDLSGTPSLGLQQGEAMTGSSFNVVTYVLGVSSSVRQALENLLELHRLLHDEQRYQLSMDDEVATLSSVEFVGAPARVQRYLAEIEMTGFSRLLRHRLGDVRPHSVHFKFPAPVYRDEYTRIFHGVERFSQPFTGVVFDRRLLDAPSLHKDEKLHQELHVYAKHSVSRLEHSQCFAQRVREVLLKQLMPSKMTMQVVATALGVTARSLRRRLAAEGTSYQEVAEEVSGALAKRMLSTEGRTVQDVAHLMGYSTSSAFHRAFKRWTGTTPNAFCGRR